jgi:hypothetical protein
MLLRDTPPWLEKPYTMFFFTEFCRAQHAGCVFGNLIGDELRRNRTLAERECHLHGTL